MGLNTPLTTIINIMNLHIGPLVFALWFVARVTCEDPRSSLFSESSITCPEKCICSWTLTNCTRGQLYSLPEGIPAQVEVLDLSYNDFTTLPADISRFKAFRHLILKHNKISSIGWLKKLESLYRVDLSSNRIVRTSDIGFLLDAAVRLQWLDLSGNNLTDLDLAKSSSLRTLKMNNCSISSVRNNLLKDFGQLEVLELSNNNIMILPHLRSANLTVLDLSRCNIQYVNTNVLRGLERLNHLKLSHNHQMKSFFSASQNLSDLDLSNCNLESVPKGVLPNLTNLNLAGNHIRRIESDDFINSVNIKTIDLSGNSIKFVHGLAFRSLKKLHSIDMSNNFLASLDGNSFGSNPSLHTVILSRNYFSEVIHFVSRSISQLDLSECEITTVDANSLSGMSSIVLLNLTRNGLTAIPENFSSTSLSVLDLSYCRISNVDNRTFGRLRNLFELNLRGNRLTEMRTKYLHDIGTVFLADNTWHCDCKSAHFKDLFFHLKMITSDVYDLTCQSPESHKGYLWYEACRSWFALHSGNNDRIWKFSIIVILVFFVGYFVIRLINRARNKRRGQVDGSRQEVPLSVDVGRAETNEQEFSEENHFLNAPDPREDRPPSYVEALTFPPLGSCTSLDSRKSSQSAAANDNNRRRNNNNNINNNNGSSNHGGSGKNGKPRKRRKRRKSKSAPSATSEGECDDESSNNQTDAEIYKETEV